MGETWYRGQSSSVPPSRPGGAIHDFGDGVYLTSSKDVAQRYADTRVSQGGGQPQVFQIQIERTELGKVLDLNNDPRWTRFLRQPAIPGMANRTPEDLIRMANENYGRFFEQFVQQNNIRIQDYDAVVGPEFVRGGSQLCILNRNGQPSVLATRISARFQPIEPAVSPTEPAVPVVPGRNLVQQSRVQGIVGNQAAMAMLGQLLGQGIQFLGDVGIRRQVQQKLATTHAKGIESILAQGQGVLVIISMEEWEEPDFNGMRGRMLLEVYIEGGPTQAVALRNWQGTPKYLKGPAKGWRSFENYVWIDPLR